jgi:hypothetical protein
MFWYQRIQSLLIVAAICALCAVHLGRRLCRGDRQIYVNEAWIVFACQIVAIIVWRQFRPKTQAIKPTGYHYCPAKNRR